MLFLYILGIIAILMLFFPYSMISGLKFDIFIPIAYSVILIVTWVFNGKKKDSFYYINETKKKLYMRGIFHPIFSLTSALFYLSGFVIFYVVKGKFGTIIKNIKDIFAELNLGLGLAALFIVFAFIILFIKWSLSKKANSIRLRTRAFLYVLFLLLGTGALFYSLYLVNFDLSHFFSLYIMEPGFYNLYAFLLPICIYILFDCGYALVENMKARPKACEEPVEEEKNEDSTDEIKEEVKQMDPYYFPDYSNETVKPIVLDKDGNAIGLEEKKENGAVRPIPVSKDEAPAALETAEILSPKEEAKDFSEQAEPQIEEKPLTKKEKKMKKAVEAYQAEIELEQAILLQKIEKEHNALLKIEEQNNK